MFLRTHFTFFFPTKNDIKWTERNGTSGHQKRGGIRQSHQYSLPCRVDLPARSSRMGRKVVRREAHGRRERAFGKQLRGSSCWISAVAVMEPGATACPIDFSSATNWTIFHGVMLRATACLFSYPSIAPATCPAWGAALRASTVSDSLFKVNGNAGE